MTADLDKSQRLWPGPRLSVAAGVGGPLLLGGTILTLTLRQQAFLRSLGWDPLLAPTVDWPSGLALSPDGAWMIAAFLASGALLSVFATGLHRHLAAGGRPPWGSPWRCWRSRQTRPTSRRRERWPGRSTTAPTRCSA